MALLETFSFQRSQILIHKNHTRKQKFHFYLGNFFPTSLICWKFFRILRWILIMTQHQIDIWGRWVLMLFPGSLVLCICCRPWGILAKSKVNVSLTRYKDLKFGFDLLLLPFFFETETRAKFGAGWCCDVDTLYAFANSFTIMWASNAPYMFKELRRLRLQQFGYFYLDLVLCWDYWSELKVHFRAAN